VVATEEDFVAAKKLGMALWTPTSRRILEAHRKLKQAFAMGEAFTAKQAAAPLGQTNIDVTNRLLRDLEEFELASCIEEKRGRRPARWAVLEIAANEPQVDQPRRAGARREHRETAGQPSRDGNTRSAERIDDEAPPAPAATAVSPPLDPAQAGAANGDSKRPRSVDDTMRLTLCQNPSRTAVALAKIAGLPTGDAQRALDRGRLAGWAERTDLGGVVIYNPEDRAQPPTVLPSSAIWSTEELAEAQRQLDEAIESGEES
jgi:hypothetical protein